MNLFDQSAEQKERKFEHIDLKDGKVLFMPNFMSKAKSYEYFEILENTIDWRQEQIKMYGKVYDVPRKTAWYGYSGFNYSYSGIECNPEPWTKELIEIKKVIEYFLPEHDFNSVLLNFYKDGNDKVSWHADDEKELGDNPTIASVSLGATRRFDLKHKDEPKNKKQIELPSGSLIVMTSGLQSHWLHQIPVQKRIKEPRINLTFRRIIKQ